MTYPNWSSPVGPRAARPGTVPLPKDLVPVPVLPPEASEQEKWLAAEETARRSSVIKKRLYYDGGQYDADNATALKAKNCDPFWDRLPEQDRLHAYSTQIKESIDFIADQLSEGFVMEAKDASVTAVLEGMVANTPMLTGQNDEGEDGLVVDEVLQEALVAGDVPVEYGWDPIEGAAYLTFWEGENVQIDWRSTTVIERVTRQDVQWIVDDYQQERQVTVRYVYEMHVNEVGRLEARKDTFWDQEDSPRDSEWLSLPFLPWRVLRGNTKGLRPTRGESLISDQTMQHADRYNAVEQVSYLISRYNSHGNLAVIGDAASLELKQDSRLAKDVADVITFPGGTSLAQITLPTDPQMINHQRGVLGDAIYAGFGLVRVEPDTLQGLGGVSGYALEILNRKTEGTFRRIRRNWMKDWRTMIDGLLDFVAFRQDARLVIVDPLTQEMVEADLEDPEYVVPEGLLPMVAWWLVDPKVTFPNREVEVRMGSGYIVDDVKVRDDFVAELISLKEALRQRGYSKKRIDEIVKEIDEAKPEQPEVPAGGFGARPVASPPGTAAGRTLSAASPA